MLKLIDPSQLLSDQIKAEDDYIPSLGLSFSYYVNEERSTPLFPRSRKIVLITGGATWKYSNNLATLLEVEVQTIDSIGVNRSIIDTQKAYKGDFESEIETVQIFADYYNVGWTNSNIGFHFRGTIDIGPHIPIYSVRGGLLFSARKKEDIKTILNFEIFYGLNDILKDNGEEDVLSRNILGMQTTVPFNF